MRERLGGRVSVTENGSERREKRKMERKSEIARVNGKGKRREMENVGARGKGRMG